MGCWPNLGEAARAEAAKGTYLFSRSPLDQLGDQQKFFFRELEGALSQVVAAAKPVTDALDGHPRKQLLRAFAADGGRFANAERTVRAIVYSDMAENSDLGSVFKPLPAERLQWGDRLGAYLRHGISRLSIVGLSGTFRCTAQPACKLDATTAGGLVTSSRAEQVAMAGPEPSALAGQLGIKGSPYLYSIKVVEQ